MFYTLLLLSSLAVASPSLLPAYKAYKVHPFPGGDTIASPYYTVLVHPPPSTNNGADSSEADPSPSFVWYTSVANRQPILPGNNVPQTDRSKSTSFTSFDVSGPTLVTVVLSKNASLTTTATVLPSSAGIVAQIAPDQRSVSLAIASPRQVCLIINGNMDIPLCIFADPPEVSKLQLLCL